MLTTRVLTFLVVVAAGVVGIVGLAALFLSLDRRRVRNLPPSDSRRP